MVVKLGSSTLSLEERLDAELAAARAEAELRRTEKFRLFNPYEPQIEFYARGKTKRERLFMAGNQTGKTRGGAYEATCHLTGLYPVWWPGRKFNHPVMGWAGGEGALLVRNKIQGELCGKPGSPADFGTGLIPKELIVGRTLSHGVTDAFDAIHIKHITGGTSTLGFKSYDQGREKWQSETLDFVWEDEEPPDDIHEEALARLTGKGFLFVTCTPLQGETRFIRRFTAPATPAEAVDRSVTRMGLKHVSHFTEEEKQQRINGYPAHQRRARMDGDPVVESGQIYLTPEQDLTVQFPEAALEYIAGGWPKIWGIDFGGASETGHPFAAALCAIDPQTQIFYVMRVLRMRGSTPITESVAMRMIAANPPVAWPHDGTHAEKSSGEKLSEIYRKKPCELNMLADHATHAHAGGYHFWPGIAEIDLAMRTGKFKVISTCFEFFDEYRAYRMEKGRDDTSQAKVHKLDDDVLDAVRYAWMMRRYARPVPFGGQKVERRRGSVLPGADESHWGY